MKRGMTEPAGASQEPLLEGEAISLNPKGGGTLGKSMTTKADFNKYSDQNLPGLIHGFDFPISVGQISQYGPAWLTKAFRASQAITTDVTVSSIVSVKDVTGDVGGGAGDKAILCVEYSGHTTAPTKFFVKLPCKDIGDRLQAAEMEAGGPEVNESAYAYSCCPAPY